MIPAIIPPIVSIEKDLPGTEPICFFAINISFAKVYPETQQKGSTTIKVKIMLNKNEGVSPGFNNSLAKKIKRNNEIAGLSEKIRLIFLILIIDDLPAIDAPMADPINHDARNVPVISSYPPEIFIISLINSN